MNIAVIPARGGSKRIPRKNIRIFHGRPMIAWAIDLANASGLFEHVVVSTDDEEIAGIAEKYGAEVPFVRPADLANDLASTVPVIAQAAAACEELGWFSNFICCIYPCAPFIRQEELEAALKMLEEIDADYVYPVVEYSHPIQRAMLRSERGEMNFLQPEYELTRTQELPRTFHDAGQFYWGKSSAWKAKKNMHSAGLGLVVPGWRLVDIDNEDDWLRAELLFEVISRADTIERD